MRLWNYATGKLLHRYHLADSKEGTCLRGYCLCTQWLSAVPCSLCIVVAHAEKDPSNSADSKQSAAQRSNSNVTAIGRSLSEPGVAALAFCKHSRALAVALYP